MRRSIALTGASLLMIGMFGVSAQEGGPTGAWQADATVLKQLGAAVAVDNYTIQTPKGYSLQRPNDAPAGFQAFAWTGATRKDGTKPSVMVNLITIPVARQEKMKNMSAEQLAEKMIGGIQRLRTNWKQEKTEIGKISGLTFARIRWEGIEPRNQWEMRGVMYVARDGDSIIQLASQDLIAPARKSIPLAEASILTFKKK